MAVTMIKRGQGVHVRGTSYWSHRHDLWLKVLTHNIMILLRIEVFYRAVLTPFCSRLFSDDFLSTQ
jgi:hypothetical protein